jgi:hypothetical protein
MNLTLVLMDLERGLYSETFEENERFQRDTLQNSMQVKTKISKNYHP